jgi:hypothetical protein
MVLTWELHFVIFFLISLSLIYLLSIWRLNDLLLLLFWDVLLPPKLWVLDFIFLREVSN